jgi:hypothetical protein
VFSAATREGQYAFGVPPWRDPAASQEPNITSLWPLDRIGTHLREERVVLFATADLSIFQFGKSRSSKVPQAVFGKDTQPRALAVDRYAGYNKIPCKIRYCYVDLLREVEDLEKEFREEFEISFFAAVVAPHLALAMGLRGQPISDDVLYRRAAALREEIKATMAQPAKRAASVSLGGQPSRTSGQ